MKTIRRASLSGGLRTMNFEHSFPFDTMNISTIDKIYLYFSCCLRMNDEERKKAGIKKAGQLMLQGWIMLAEHCPICHSVLFSNKSKSECVCPTCDVSIKKECELNNSEKEQFGCIKKSQKTEEKVMVSDEEDYDCYEDDIDVPNSLEDLKAEWEEKMKVRDLVSAKIGEYMLTGWSMLATTCSKYKENHPAVEGVILVGKGDVTKCVACEHKIGVVKKNKSDLSASTGAAKIVNIPTAEQPHVANQPAPPRSTIDSIPMQAKFNNNSEVSLIDEASGLIGNYLLKGYSLLDATCSNVNADCCGKVPLIQHHKTSDKICVMCEKRSKEASANDAEGAKSQGIDVDGADLESNEDEDLLRLSKRLTSIYTNNNAVRSTNEENRHDGCEPNKFNKPMASSGGCGIPNNNTLLNTQNCLIQVNMNISVSNCMIIKYVFLIYLILIENPSIG